MRYRSSMISAARCRSVTSRLLVVGMKSTISPTPSSVMNRVIRTAVPGR